MVMLLPLLLAAVAPAADPLVGTWVNPAGSVRIRVAACGDEPGLCGTVIAANDKARDDAARGGTDRLIGTRLFRGLRQQRDGGYAGTVFVPDLNSEVDGMLHLDGRNVLVAEGCLFAGFGCQQQRWTRAPGPR